MKRKILTLLFSATVLMCATAQNEIIRGLRMPRMSTEQRDQIMVSGSPFAEGQHIFNLNTHCEEFWNGEEWKSLCGSLGKAELTVDCNAFFINMPSNYFNGRDLTNSHYIEFPVTVTKKGTYAFTILPHPSNGYYFEASGEFLEPGNFTVRMQGVGKPINFSVPENDITAGDTLVLQNYGGELCRKVLHINNGAQAEYLMQCGSVKYNGVYKLNTPLDASHTITITISVAAVNPGAVAVLETNEVDGMKFVSNATPITSTGNMEIVLYGTGEPGSAGVRNFTISSNSDISTATCNISLNVVMRKKRILVFGSGIYSPATANATAANSSRRFLLNQRNFGTLSTSTVQVEEIEIVHGGTGVVTPARLASLTPGHPNFPDAVMIFFDSGLDENARVTQILGDYVRGGNPLLLCPDGAAVNSGTDNLVNNIFGSTTMTTGVSAIDAVWMYKGVNHPILNGPFGDVRGKHWGDDASASILVRNIPVDDVVLFSDAYDWSRSTAVAGGGYSSFMHRTLPFIYIGDGGFLSYSSTLNDDCCYPFKLDATDFPAPKVPHGIGTTDYPVYNSLFFGNLMAWMFKFIEGIPQ